MFMLSNAHNGLIVYFPLFQLKGCIDPFCYCKTINLFVKYEIGIDHEMEWILCYKNFKVFIPLRFGVNIVTLKCSHYEALFTLEYRLPVKQEFIVRPVYFICQNEDGNFQSLEGHPNSKEVARRRIGFALRLLQTLTAEAFYIEFGQRHTFLCSENADFDNELCCGCLIHYSKFTTTDIFKLKPKDVWSKVACELHLNYKSVFNSSKWVVFMACTRYLGNKYGHNQNYDHILKNTNGFYALGTGGLALLGSGTLHTWPENLTELQSILFDARRIDETYLMDDTAYRHTFWAAFSTGLGSVWHELGHCFGLDHYLHGIMNRGCDDIHLCIGFILPGLCCVHGCKSSIEKYSEFLKSNAKNNTLSQFSSPLNVSTALQFKIVKFVEYLSLNSVTLKNDQFAHQWGFCQSLWHQGMAFWGLDAILKLKESPWIIKVEANNYYFGKNQTSL